MDEEFRFFETGLAARLLRRAEELTAKSREASTDKDGAPHMKMARRKDAPPDLA